MIGDAVLRRVAAERGIDLGLIEKDYHLGWVLKGVSATLVGDRLGFKGGTALSKVYYPLDWRISEDLDFTLLNDISSRLRDELSSIEDLSATSTRRRR